MYGIFEVTDEMNVVRLVEKPVEIFSKLANIGAYKFTPEVFDVLRNTPPSERGEIEVTCGLIGIAGLNARGERDTAQVRDGELQTGGRSQRHLRHVGGVARSAAREKRA